MAVDIGVPINSGSSSSLSFDAQISGARWIYFSWADSVTLPDEDRIETIKPEKLDNIGEILSHLLIQFVRQSYY